MFSLERGSPVLTEECVKQVREDFNLNQFQMHFFSIVKIIYITADFKLKLLGVYTRSMHSPVCMYFPQISYTR